MGNRQNGDGVVRQSSLRLYGIFIARWRSSCCGFVADELEISRVAAPQRHWRARRSDGVATATWRDAEHG